LAASGRLPGVLNVDDLVDDRFLVLDYLGHGRTGDLYKVRDAYSTSEYALKVIDREVISKAAWQNFQRESDSVKAFSNPNIVSLRAIGLHQQMLPYFVTELVLGLDLAELLGCEGPLKMKEALVMVSQVSSALSYAHAKGVIHSQLKPSCIFHIESTAPSGKNWKVADFGIESLWRLDAVNNNIASGTSASYVNLNASCYLSPEQCLGEQPDARSDIYSLGCILYESIAGYPPFRGDTPLATMALHHSQDLYSAPGYKDITPQLQEVLTKALAKRPSDRYQSIELLDIALAELSIARRSVLASPAVSNIEKDEVDKPVPLVQSDNERSPLFLKVFAIFSVCGLLSALAYAYWLAAQTGEVIQTSAVGVPGSTRIAASQLQERKVSADPASFDNAGSLVRMPMPGPQIVSASLLIKVPYCTFRIVDGQKMRCFKFPTDVVIGQIVTGDPPLYYRASGNLRFRLSDELTFIPASVVGRFPRCLERFLKTDIHGILIDSEDEDSKTLSAVLEMSEVQLLNFAESKHLDKIALKKLKNFHEIKVFIGSHSEPTDGGFLAEINDWVMVEQMYLYHTKNILPLLKKLKNAPRLRRLTIESSPLQAHDCSALAELANVERLDLSGSHFNDNDLLLLKKMPHLTSLQLDARDATLPVIDVLRHFSKLRTIYINDSAIKPKAVRSLREALPSLTVI